MSAILTMNHINQCTQYVYTFLYVLESVLRKIYEMESVIFPTQCNFLYGGTSSYSVVLLID